MKQTVLITIIYAALAVFIVHKSSGAIIITSHTILRENLIEQAANQTNISKVEAQICADTANIETDDFKRTDQFRMNEFSPANNESAYKYGCFLACIYKKKGIMIDSHIDIKALIETYPSDITNDQLFSWRYELVLYTCGASAWSFTDECEAVRHFKLCSSQVGSFQHKLNERFYKILQEQIRSFQLQ